MTEGTGSSFIVELEGVDEVVRRLEKIPEATEAVLQRLAELVKLAAIPYPPEGPWNRPGPYPSHWYQRQFGPRWTVKSGEIHGRDTSQQLQKSWVTGRQGRFEQYVGTRVSYADYVMGERQTGFHQAHGWRRLRDVAYDVVKDNLSEIGREEIERAVEGG